MCCKVQSLCIIWATAFYVWKENREVIIKPKHWCCHGLHKARGHREDLLSSSLVSTAGMFYWRPSLQRFVRNFQQVAPVCEKQNKKEEHCSLFLTGPVAEMLQLQTKDTKSSGCARLLRRRVSAVLCRSLQLVSMNKAGGMRERLGSSSLGISVISLSTQWNHFHVGPH